MTRATLPVLLLAATLASVFPMDANASDWYVDPVNGSNSNGGTSWADAWKTITYAEAATTEEYECALHLAPGVYSPSSNGESIPIEYQRGGASLLGSGAEVTIIDGEGIYRPL
ncbi:MAG: hypothetical protein JW759_04360, partial [Candidatus Coatesbacteria bacterium]|nr:hypothetical protein [Candidatus Coatesbacteria bacterium]